MGSKKESIKVYWDSCLFTGLFKREPDKSKFLEPVIKSAAAGEVRIVTSIISKLEVLHLRRGEAAASCDYENDFKMIDGFFDHSYITLLPVTGRVIEEALTLRRKMLSDTGRALTLQDSIHAVTAKVNGLDNLFTTDGKGAQNRRPLIGCDSFISPVRVMLPEDYESFFADDNDIFHQSRNVGRQTDIEE